MLLLSSTNCQLFSGLFSDIDVRTARQLGYNFDAASTAGINFNKPIDDGLMLSSNVGFVEERSRQPI